MHALATQTTRFLLTIGVMQPMPHIRHLTRRIPCTSTHAIDRPCANPMCAIMIAKSRFDTGFNIQYAATMLLAWFPFFCCTSTSNTLNTMFRGEHTRHHTWMCAFPVTMHFLPSCMSSFSPTHCNALQRCSPCPSSLFFFSEVSLHVLAPPYLIGRPSSSTLVAKNSSIPLTFKGVSRVANTWPTTSLLMKRNQPQGNKDPIGSKTIWCEVHNAIDPHGWGPQLEALPKERQTP